MGRGREREALRSILCLDMHHKYLTTVLMEGKNTQRKLKAIALAMEMWIPKLLKSFVGFEKCDFH